MEKHSNPLLKKRGRLQRRKQIKTLFSETMKRRTVSPAPAPVPRARWHFDDIKVAECSSLIELSSQEEAAANRSVLHACTQMCPYYLNQWDLQHELSHKKSLIVLSSSARPCAAALVRWHAGHCILDFICSVVRSSGRKLFHNLMHLADARNIAFLRLIAVPALAEMYSTWGGASIFKEETDLDLGIFVFSVSEYVRIHEGPLYCVKCGIYIYFENNISDL